MSGRPCRRFGSERGAQILELVIVTPALLFVIAGIAESGLLFRSFEVAANAAREGARLAALPANQQNDYATVRARVTNYLADANLTSATPPVIAITTEQIPIANGTVANGVRVTITYTYDCLFLGPVAGLLNGTFQDTITYQTSAMMRTHLAAVGI